MNALFTRISTISVILFVCVCNTLEVKADKSDEYFLLEARLSKKTMRSSAPQQGILPQSVNLKGEVLTQGFNRQWERVPMNAYSEMNKLQYLEYSTESRQETVPMDSTIGEVYTNRFAALLGKFIKLIFVE